MTTATTGFEGPPVTNVSPQVGEVAGTKLLNTNVDNQVNFNRLANGTIINYGQRILFEYSINQNQFANTWSGNTNYTASPVGGTIVRLFKGSPSSVTGFWTNPTNANQVAWSAYEPGFTNGYGHHKISFTGNQITNEKNGISATLNWINGHNLTANTEYSIWIPGISGAYNQQVNGPILLTFTTLPAYIAPLTINPRINNGLANTTPIVITTTTNTATLTCNFYYPSLTQANYYPAEVVFLYRVVNTTTWIPTPAIPIPSTYTITPNSRSNQTITISGLIQATDYEYTSYIKDLRGIIFYASLTTYSDPYTNNDTLAQRTPFKTKPATISQWQDPTAGGTWYQLYNDWQLVTTPNANNRVVPYFTVRANSSGSLFHSNFTDVFSLFRYLNKEFVKDKNYQFRTIVESFYQFRGDANLTCSKSNFIMKTPWGEEYNYSGVNTPYFPITSAPNSIKVINLYLYSNINSFPSSLYTKPINKIISKNNPQNPISYTANSYFNGALPTTSSILDLNISDFDWVIHGFAPFNITTYTSGPLDINGDEIIPVFLAGDPIGGKGWHFIENKGQFIWFDKYNRTDTTENIMNLPIGGNINDYHTGKTSDHKYLTNNFISKYISYQTFNISFDYKNNSPFSVSMYVGGILPNFEPNVYNLDKLISDGYVKKVLSLYKSTNGVTQSCEFVGVDGNQYLFFVADPVYKHTDSTNTLITPTLYNSTIDNSPLTSTTYSIISLSNFKIAGAYNDQNNKNFDVNTFGSVPYSTIIPILNATYSIKLGSGNNVIPGSVNDIVEVNSAAGNGRFNAGIWENGVWNNGWREDLTRREFYKIDQFYSYEKDKKWRVRISGPVSSLTGFIIGDKISISNIIAIDINEERKLLKKYYTIVEIGSNYIEVEFENDFPLRRIEMDSDEHRIYVSKNVWLSGVFLNGYFKGIWNSGLFSGYPLITKMDDSHWIDGIFNGGHFTANKYGTTFSSVFPVSVNGVTRLGLSFSTPHKLTFDDIISINPNTYYVSTIPNNNSLGTTTVSDVIDENRLATGINWKSEYLPILNGGKVYSIVSSGLIQNFDFYSNNVSTVTSLQSLSSERVFSYNSWIDVNYSNQSAVNIGKPQSILEGDTKRSYSENNLYGYPTNDILSSNSVFRDSFSTSFRKYKLGKKWKIFNDYVGDSSSFEEYFDSSDTTAGLEAFNTQGWDISINSDNDEKITAQKIDYTPQLVFGTQPLLKMYFDNDITAILLSTNVIIEGIMNIISPPPQGGGGGLIPSTSTYKSNATISLATYDAPTNLTEVSLIATIPVAERVTFNNSRSLDKTATSYLTFPINNGLTFSRTPEPLNSNSLTIGKELKVKTTNKGGYLNLIPAYDVTNRTNGTDTITIEKIRYSLVEFDIVDHISATTSYIDSNTGYRQPSIHFNNLNYTTRNFISTTGTQSLVIPATYLPINKNINHLLTRSKKKQEFFFNKRNLLMNFKGTGLLGNFEAEYYLDNIKFYQVNMIPFFQYFISPIGVQGNINKSVQIPNNGISPIIDYTEDNIIDANNDNNDIITFFSNSLIASNIEIPAGINWQRDYSIYRTQISGNDILGSDDPYLTI